MRAFDEFRNMDCSFWALVKYISETLGYTVRGQGTVRTYTLDEMFGLLATNGIAVDMTVLEIAKLYFDKRAELLNNVVKRNLMTADEAKKEFQQLYDMAINNGFLCKIPMNKQKGAMRQVAFFTAIINIITEAVIRRSNVYYNTPKFLGFNDDPRGLAYILDDYNRIIGASSRRFDGAYPDILNPKAVWEIKEYYYATTFGSRVADGVYETQLDGYEFKEISSRTGRSVVHIFFLDAYKTWWDDGKSYLCRIIDALNSGLVDEVIVGREVLTRWPQVLQNIIDS